MFYLATIVAYGGSAKGILTISTISTNNYDFTVYVLCTCIFDKDPVTEIKGQMDGWVDQIS